MPKTTKNQSSKDNSMKINTKKWSAVNMKPGFTVLPNVLIEKQAALGLDPVDMNILLHLAMHWWKPENKPFPSKSTVAKAIGRSPDTVRRHIKELEGAGLIKRIQRRIPGVGSKTNIYELDGLINEAKPFAREMSEEIETKKKAKQQRIARKKPKKHARKVEDS